MIFGSSWLHFMLPRDVGLDSSSCQIPCERWMVNAGFWQLLWFYPIHSHRKFPPSSSLLSGWIIVEHQWFADLTSVCKTWNQHQIINGNYVWDVFPSAWFTNASPREVTFWGWSSYHRHLGWGWNQDFVGNVHWIGTTCRGCFTLLDIRVEESITNY